MIKLGISGALGKMGRRLLSMANKDDELEVVFGLERKGHKEIGKIIEGVKIEDNPEVIKMCDCLIEFTTPQATVEHLPYLIKFKKSAVIGTTGLNEQQVEKVKEAAKFVPIVFSPNMSVGVNLLFKLVKEASKTLKGYKVYIQETHHIHKKDAPSGTAKKLAQIINNSGLRITPEEIKAIREDEVVGDHIVTFESDFDKIELLHSAKTRDIFVKGALLGAKWVVAQRQGLYSMDDVLFSKVS